MPSNPAVASPPTRTNGEKPHDLFRNRLRLNPALRLVPFDQLSEAVQDNLGALAREHDFFGILVPRSGTPTTPRSLSNDAALLLYAVQEPAVIPYLADKIFGTHAAQRVLQLIADGILEIETETGFMSGAVVLPKLSLSQIKPSRAIQLSHFAIEYGALFPSLPAPAIARRLYMFNRMPSTPQLQLAFQSTDQTLAYLTKDSATVRRLTENWVHDAKSGFWISFRAPSDQSPPTYKLYVSPSIEALPDAFPVIVAALVRARCTSFKVGLTASGLLRPDKLVAYFDRLEPMLEASDLMQAGLHGTAAHGVPFAAVMDSAGLLSWGMDPSSDAANSGSGSNRSWREWVTSRVATHIVSARHAGSPVFAFVHGRLALDGIDSQNWSPNLAIWNNSPEF